MVGQAVLNAVGYKLSLLKFKQTVEYDAIHSLSSLASHGCHTTLAKKVNSKELGHDFFGTTLKPTKFIEIRENPEILAQFYLIIL